MAEKGVVTKSWDDKVQVMMIRTEACAKCRACVAGLSEKEMFIEAENACGAKEGDWVEMELVSGAFAGAVFIMYGIPLAALLVGLLAGYYALAAVIGVTSDSVRALCGFLTAMVATALAYFWIKSQESRWSKKKYTPVARSLTVPDEEEAKKLEQPLQQKTWEK